MSKIRLTSNSAVIKCLIHTGAIWKLLLSINSNNLLGTELLTCWFLHCPYTRTKS